MVLFWQAKEMTEKSKKNENSTKAVFVFLQTLALLQLLMIPGQDLRQQRPFHHGRPAPLCRQPGLSGTVRRPQAKIRLR